MKILYLNIFKGCPEKDRFKKIINFIKLQKPDILGLTELNGWEEDNFKKLNFFKKQTNFNYAIFGKATSAYNIGLFSRFPFSTSYTSNVGFKTAMIAAKIDHRQPINLVLTHLHSDNEDLRLNELGIIFKKINTKDPTIFMGDLNSLSPEDKYDEKKLLQEMKNINSNKFGKTKIRRQAIEYICKKGFIDAVKKYSRKFEPTVPTLYNTDPYHFRKLRLDYIFFNKRLEPTFVKAVVINTPTTNQLSDHLPVKAYFDL